MKLMMRKNAYTFLGAAFVAMLMVQPVSATDASVSYEDEQGDLKRFIIVDQGLIHEETPLGLALACVDILGSSLTLTSIDGVDVYVFEMTTLGALPMKGAPSDIDLSSIVCLFWFWTLEFSDSDDFNFWNSYDVMLIWDCERQSYSAMVWDYTPCIATDYQPDRLLVGTPEVTIDGSTVKMVMPVSWLPEDNWHEFCWMFLTAVRFGEDSLEKVNRFGYFTGGTDFWVDKPDPEVAIVDPYPTNIFPWLVWPA